MTTVYLVSKGEYSDYRIVAVFSAREPADAYVAETNERDTYAYARVEEHDLDTPREALPGCYAVGLNLHGEVVDSDWDSVSAPSDPPEERPWADGRQGRFFWGYGQSVEHARRSAENLRRETLAAEGVVVR
jgi:hypothetical protein